MRIRLQTLQGFVGPRLCMSQQFLVSCVWLNWLPEVRTKCTHFSAICRKHGHTQLHCLSVLVRNPIDYFFSIARLLFLQLVRILYGRFQGSGMYFLFSQRCKTQHDFVFAVRCIFPEFMALRNEESDQNPVLTAAMNV